MLCMYKSTTKMFAVTNSVRVQTYVKQNVHVAYRCSNNLRSKFNNKNNLQSITHLHRGKLLQKYCWTDHRAQTSTARGRVHGHAFPSNYCNELS